MDSCRAGFHAVGEANVAADTHSPGELADGTISLISSEVGDETRVLFVKWSNAKNRDGRPVSLDKFGR
eukprot:7649344-Pyramimonas_sp.AAC.1